MDEPRDRPERTAGEQLAEDLAELAMTLADEHPSGPDPLRAPEPLMERLDRERRGRRLATPLAFGVFAFLVASLLLASVRNILTSVPHLTSTPDGGTTLTLPGLPCPGSGLLFAAVFAGAAYLIFFRTEGRGALRFLGAVPAAPGDLAVTREVVDDMAIAFGLGKPPAVHVVEARVVNAFIAGRRLDDAVVAVSRGLVEAMDREQQRAVVAHLFARHLMGKTAIASGDSDFSEQADTLAMQTLREPDALLRALETARSSDTFLRGRGVGVLDAFFFVPLLPSAMTVRALDQRIARLRAVLGAEGAAT